MLQKVKKEDCKECLDIPIVWTVTTNKKICDTEIDNTKEL